MPALFPITQSTYQKFYLFLGFLDLCLQSVSLFVFLPLGTGCLFGGPSANVSSQIRYRLFVLASIGNNLTYVLLDLLLFQNDIDQS